MGVHIHFYQDTGLLGLIAGCYAKIKEAIRSKANLFMNLLLLRISVERDFINFLP